MREHHPLFDRRRADPVLAFEAFAEVAGVGKTAEHGNLDHRAFAVVVLQQFVRLFEAQLNQFMAEGSAVFGEQ